MRAQRLRLQAKSDSASIGARIRSKRTELFHFLAGLLPFEDVAGASGADWCRGIRVEHTAESLVCPRCGRKAPGPLGAVCEHDGAALIEPAVYAELGDRPDRLIGRVVAGRFPVIELIGRGAYGTVYRAVQQPVGREVALKVMNTPRDATLRARFFREARVVARLTHASTVTLFDYGEDDDGLLWMALELIRGPTLRDVILDDAPLAPARAARLTLQVLGALVEAHAAGLVHRDLKPANVMLAGEATGDERAKVLDFGMAKVLEVQGIGRADEATRTGLVVGTPRYLSPEQALARQVGPQTDVYALGVVLFEMLAGEPPFVAPSTFELLMLHTTAEIPPLDPALRVPVAMEAVIHRAMAKAVEDRFADAQEMLDALRVAAEGAPTRAAVERSAAPQAVADATELSADDLRSVAKQAQRLLPDARIAADLRSERPPAAPPPPGPPTASDAADTGPEARPRTSRPPPTRTAPRTAPPRTAPPRALRSVRQSLGAGPATFEPPPLAPDALDHGMSATHGELNAFATTDEHAAPGRGRLGAGLMAVGFVAVGLAAWLLLGKRDADPESAGLRAASVAMAVDAAPTATAEADASRAPEPPPAPEAVRDALGDARRAVDREQAQAAPAVAAASALADRLLATLPDDEDKAAWNLDRAQLWQQLAQHQEGADQRRSLLAARADLAGAMTYGSREHNFDYFRQAVTITQKLFGDGTDEMVEFACKPAHVGDYLHRGNICAIHEIRAGTARREDDPAGAAKLICAGAERFVAELPNLSPKQIERKRSEKRHYGAQCTIARRNVAGESP